MTRARARRRSPSMRRRSTTAPSSPSRSSEVCSAARTFRMRPTKFLLNIAARIRSIFTPSPGSNNRAVTGGRLEGNSRRARTPPRYRPQGWRGDTHRGAAQARQAGRRASASTSFSTRAPSEEFGMFAEHRSNDFGMEKSRIAGDGVVTDGVRSTAAPSSSSPRISRCSAARCRRRMPRRSSRSEDMALKNCAPIIGIYDAAARASRKAWRRSAAMPRCSSATCSPRA